MSLALGFDVYGTLVNLLDLRTTLQGLVGDLAETFAVHWRQKQIEYAFRRTAMQDYADFNTITREAMEYTIAELGVELSERGRRRLMDAYESLRPYRDAAPALTALRDAGHTLVAFTNGVEASARTVLDHAQLLPYFEQIISVDAVQTFKPSPVVYHYLAERLGRPPGETMLVSGNVWDVVGARGAGLRAAWVRRNSRTVYDPWGAPPDLIVSDLNDLAAKLADTALTGVG